MDLLCWVAVLFQVGVAGCGIDVEVLRWSFADCLVRKGFDALGSGILLGFVTMMCVVSEVTV